jgi:hypothetical protein
MRSGLAKLAILVAPLLFLGRSTQPCENGCPEVRLHADQIDVTARNQFAVIAP